MEIQGITPQEYESIFASTYHIFNNVEFSELNKDKCKELHYLILKESKIKYGLENNKKIRISLPPYFYNDIHIAKTFSALIRNNAKYYIQI
ncbi:MAG: hypothetical protein IJV31_10050 [Clostridia bacterium]|nr:hypothetical protein [Clostridia bacterium]